VHKTRVFDALVSVVSVRVNSAAIEARQAVRAALEAIFVLIVGRSRHLLFNLTASVFRNRVFSRNTDGNTGNRNILRKNAKAKERGVLDTVECC
jgi:hypothetical protein